MGDNKIKWKTTHQRICKVKDQKEVKDWFKVPSEKKAPSLTFKVFCVNVEYEIPFSWRLKVLRERERERE